MTAFKRILTLFFAFAFLCATAHASFFESKRLKEAYAKRAELTDQLQALETEEAHLSQSLDHTKKSIQTNKKEQEVLRVKQAALQATIKTTIASIKHLLQVSYLWKQQPKLKWLLSDKSHQDLNDMDHYQKVIESKREADMKKLRALQKQLEENKASLLQKADQLQGLLKEQQSSMTALENTKKSRQTIIAHLDDVIKEERLKEQRNPLAWLSNKRLEPLTPTGEQAPFKPNSLFWPTRGYVDTAYGDAYHNTSLKQHGMIIRAKSGNPVHAIADGEVVFAKWLPGYGHLMIIDHHNGYLSLYGRNRYLEAEPGDWVSQGQEVATVGNSGGYVRPGLYFELRYQAQPINPLLWLKKQHYHSRWRHHDSSNVTHPRTQPNHTS